jgi:large subunit ribosomal protein L24
MKIKKNDQVLVISGKDRGRKGKVLRVLPKKEQILVEGINIIKKHVRPKKTGEKGKIIILPASISISNVKLICSKCKKITKVGYKLISNTKNQKSKIRVCKKCGEET